jgi:HD-GYP domain-containing protein (c-di-GMP phosphodiesterase class II)
VSGTVGTRPRGTLLLGESPRTTEVRRALAASGIQVHVLTGADGRCHNGGLPRVLLLDQSLAREAPDLLAEVAHGATVVAVGGEARCALADEPVFAVLPDDAGLDVLRVAIEAAIRYAELSLRLERSAADLRRSRDEVRELSGIGVALMTERDPDRLLVQILDRAMSLTSSDAGSLYLVETDARGQRVLRFRLSANRSIPDLPSGESTLPIDSTSIAGHVAATDHPLVLDDAYAPPGSAPYRINRSFDQRFGYRTRSMLVVPMTDHVGVVVGVLQLINRKRDPAAVIRNEADAERHVLAYGDRDLALVRGLAGQAAVSIENAWLYQQIEEIFEHFVKAAVTAIDQRDPTTAGHSVRVAAMTTALAERLPTVRRGPWARLRLSREEMRELRYAALLHDFGKVGVREEILVKARKLPPHLQERVEARFDLARRAVETEVLRRKLLLVQQGARPEAVAELDTELAERVRRLEGFREVVRAANEPVPLPEGAAAALRSIAAEQFEQVDGRRVGLLEADELEFLTIPHGSLDARERREIESHVTQTYRFLSQIPWTANLSQVAEIAYGHHERLDGRGYPRNSTGDEISVQTRMMMIADVFDALTASDRPYKKAFEVDRALDILVREAEVGALDGELVQLFIESRIYDEVLHRDWRDL